jgi:hypothetical protein
VSPSVAPNIGQEAALFGLQRLAGWREEKRRMMLERLQALRDAFRANALRYGLISSGAFFRLGAPSVRRRDGNCRGTAARRSP